MNKFNLGLKVKSGTTNRYNEVRLPLPVGVMQAIAERIVFPFDSTASVCVYTPEGVAVFYMKRNPDGKTIHRERRTRDGVELENRDLTVQ